MYRLRIALALAVASLPGARPNDRALDGLASALGERVTDREFFALVASLSETIKDGHTRFRYPARMEVASEEWLLLPPSSPCPGQSPVRRSRLFTGHSCLGTQRPLLPSFGGTLVVLANGGTFSAASEFAAVAAAHGRAVFVGEETGGATNGNTAGVSAGLTLPNSGIRVQVPMMRYDVVAPGLRYGRGVLPDYSVRPSVEDLVAGRDVVRRFGLDLASSRLTKEKG